MGFQIVKLTDPIQLTNVVGGLVPKGAYAAGTDYVVGDSVDYNGSSYVMHVDAVAGTLPTDTTKWQVLANKGDTGETATDHALLNNLSYAASGHTGFAPALGADDNYVTDAEKIVIGNTSGTNTGDNATNTQYSGLAASKQNADATLTSLAAYNTNGILTQTAADTFTGRTIRGTTNQITVTNGDGVSGNPTLALPQDIHTGASPTFAGLTSTGSVTVTGTAAANIAAFKDPSNATYLAISQYGKATFSGQISSYGNSYPGTDSAYTLGTSSLYWSNTYTDRLYLNATAYLDGAVAGTANLTGSLGILATSGSATHSLTLGSTSTGIALYNTSDQTTNYERVRQYWNSNVWTLVSENGGTGVRRPIFLGGASAMGISLNDNGGGAANTGKISLIVPATGSAFPIGAVATVSASSGTQYGFAVSPTINQSSTAGYTALLINPTETATGSGAKNLIDAQVGGASVFRISNNGLVFMGNNIYINTPVGMKIGTATTQKLGFYNATPVVQPSATPVDATDLATALTLVNDLKSKLVTLGLIA